MSEENKPAEMVEVKPELDQTLDLVNEINTILANKDKYRPEVLEKTGAAIISEVSKIIGVEFGRSASLTAKITELETSSTDKEAKIGELSKSLDALNESIKAKDSEISKLSDSLKEFKNIQIGQNSVEPKKVIDHQEIYRALKDDGKHVEASEYYRKNIIANQKP